MPANDISSIISQLRAELTESVQADLNYHFLDDAAIEFNVAGEPESDAMSFITTDVTHGLAAKLMRVIYIERQLQIDAERALDMARELVSSSSRE